MKKKSLSVLTALMATTLVVSACGNGNNSDSKKSSKDQVTQEEKSKFPLVVKNDNEAIKGGVFNVALVSDSPFKGIFSNELMSDNYDSQLSEFALESLFTYDENYYITNDGPVALEVDKENKEATLTINDKVKWSDGEPLKAEDIIYAYEVIGNKDYDGVRYDDKMKNIVGMEEYHDGKAATISGIEEKDDKTVVIKYKEIFPGLEIAGGGIWSSAMPKHQLKDIAIKDLEASDAIRKNPIGFGPYVVKTIKNGESVEFVPNEHYYLGKPKVEKVIVKRVPASSIVEGMKSGEYDVALSMPTDIYDSYSDLKNVQILGREELAYTYIGFKLGKWDSAKKENVMDKNAKMADVKLRQAMGYAIDNDQVGTEFYSGLRRNATSLIPPAFPDLQNTEMKGFYYDPDKANELLDEAGYKDVDGDGIREDKDGKPFVIKYAAMSGGDTAQELSDYYLQSWEAVGLKVEYTTGRLIEFNSFYDKLKSDDPDVDIYQAAWGLSTDPTPASLYSRVAQFNYSRFTSDKLDELLKDMTSEEAFDQDFRKKAFEDWQEFMAEEAPVIPTLYRYQVLPVNNRVKGLDWHFDNANKWGSIELTADKAEN